MARDSLSIGDLPLFAATFRYFGCLPELLLRKYRRDTITYHFRAHPGVKDAIEAMGIPHTEVNVILANHNSVGFGYPLQDYDVIDVYPLSVPVPAKRPLNLSPATPQPATFVLDVHLGKLARRLRLLGFDCLYRNDFEDREILQIALEQERIILTRDLGILRHRKVIHGYLVRSDQVDLQLREVLDRYLLLDKIRTWSRCPLCNGSLKKAEKASLVHRLEPKTRLYYDDFSLCQGCGKIYWSGSHIDKIAIWLEPLLEGAVRKH